MSQSKTISEVRRSLQKLLLLLTGFLVASCAAPGYYAQAVSGHMELMRQRESIAGILASGTADPEVARELELSVELRQFAVKRLYLPDNGSYTQFVATGRDALSWNVVATPEFSLTPRRWCFIVSGCVPYRGYFKQKDAAEFAGKLARKGYDTSVSPAVAYSTLGWFDDPLLDTMFRYGDEQLAAFIFHELAHQELYVSGDTAFSESYASFIEETGVRLWLEANKRAGQLLERQERQRAGQQFDALLGDTRRRLETLYANGLEKDLMRLGKSTIFQDLRAGYDRLSETQWGGQSFYETWISQKLNNASLALMDSYRGGVCAFENLYRDASLDMARFQQLAAARAELPTEQRRAWLDQPCEVIASDSDL